MKNNKKNWLLITTLIASIMINIILAVVIFSEKILDETTHLAGEVVTYESDVNEDYYNASSISIMFECDMKTKSWMGDSYQLRLSDDKSQLVVPCNGDYLYCDFSVDKYYELLELVLKHPLKVYQPQADSDGKLIYEIVPHILSLYVKGENMYFDAPDNMSEIIAEFEKLNASALK